MPFRLVHVVDFPRRKRRTSIRAYARSKQSIQRIKWFSIYQCWQATPQKNFPSGFFCIVYRPSSRAHRYSESTQLLRSCGPTIATLPVPFSLRFSIPVFALSVFASSSGSRTSGSRSETDSFESWKSRDCERKLYSLFRQRAVRTARRFTVSFQPKQLRHSRS